MLSFSLSHDDGRFGPGDQLIGASAYRTRPIRRGIKALVFGMALLAVVPLIGLTWLEKRVSRSESIFVLFGQGLALVPGFPGRWLRGAYYFGTLDACSWEVHIGFGTLFTHRGAAISPRVSLGAYCIVGHAHIGKDVMIGSRVSIPSGKRQHLDESGRLAPVTRFEPVTVGSHCWLGEGAILLADVGSGCIVSAGAVVIDAMPAGKLIGGNPARVIRDVERAADMSEG